MGSGASKKSNAASGPVQVKPRTAQALCLSHGFCWRLLMTLRVQQVRSPGLRGVDLVSLCFQSTPDRWLGSAGRVGIGTRRQAFRQHRGNRVRREPCS